MDELEEPLGLPDEPSTIASTCFGNDFQLHIRPMIDLIDKLRWMGVDKDVSLPSIVVVGDQSSGKSSVLEALSGVQLPRGSGNFLLSSVSTVIWSHSKSCFLTNLL